MKITTSTTHTILFSVRAFWDEEGGMGTERFGAKCNSLEEAIHTLELARASGLRSDWVIVADVTTVVNKK